jgi:hypothetical protein
MHSSFSTPKSRLACCKLSRRQGSSRNSPRMRVNNRVGALRPFAIAEIMTYTFASALLRSKGNATALRMVNAAFFRLTASSRVHLRCVMSAVPTCRVSRSFKVEDLSVRTCTLAGLAGSCVMCRLKKS